MTRGSDNHETFEGSNYLNGFIMVYCKPFTEHPTDVQEELGSTRDLFFFTKNSVQTALKRKISSLKLGISW